MMNEVNRKMMDRLLNAVWDDITPFEVAVNVHVDYLKNLTEEDADVKYEIVCRIVGMTQRYLKEAELSMERRIECEVFLTFYQFMQALYERRFNEKITQAYVQRMADIYNEKRIAANYNNLSEDNGILSIGKTQKP